MMKKLAAFLSAAGISLLGAAPLPEGVFSESYRECRIISIQDQAMSMPGGLFRSIDPRGTFRADESYAASLNVFVIRHEESGRIALIDAGAVPQRTLCRTAPGGHGFRQPVGSP